MGDLPGQQNVIIERKVDGQAADHNGAGEHGNDIDAGRYHGHIGREIDHRVVLLPDIPQAECRQQRGNHVNQHSQSVCAGIHSLIKLIQHGIVLSGLHQIRNDTVQIARLCQD